MPFTDRLEFEAEEKVAGSWYALYTRHQHERVVAGMLCGKGFETFLPLYSAIHRWKDRRKKVSLPLFPGYLFLHGGLERRLQIVSTPGVFSFVGPGSLPAAIAQAEIDAIRRTVEANLRAEPYPFLKAGDWVRVTFGPLAGIEAVLVREKGRHRLVLSVELLQKAVAVEIEADCVEPIKRCFRPVDVSWAASGVLAGT